MLKKITHYQSIIFVIILLVNLLFFFNLLLGIEEMRILTDIQTNLAYPTISYVFTNDPNVFNLWYDIFNFNYLVFSIYIVFLIINYFLITMIKSKKTLILTLFLEEIILIILLMFLPYYFVSILLLFNFSIALFFMLHNLSQNKSIRLNLVILWIITIIGITVNLLYRFNTIGWHRYTVFFMNQSFSDKQNLYFLENMSKYLLINSLTIIYLFFLVFLIVYSILRYVINLKQQKIFILLTFLTLSIFVIFRLITFGIFLNNNYISSNERSISPITSCFKTNMNLGLGEDYLTDHNTYFSRCYETTEGEYKVYKEVKVEGNNPFNLNKAIKYTKIYVVNAQGKTILSLNTNEENTNIYVTTKEEHNQGMDNLIFVEQHDTNYHYSFYDLQGNLILNLPNGIPDRAYTQNDALDHNSMRLFFKKGQMFYHIKNNEGVLETYVYYLDGSSEKVDDN